MKPKQRSQERGPKACTIVLLSGIAFLVLAGWILGGYAGTAWAAELQGSGWTVQGQGGSQTAQPASQNQPVTAGQAQGQTEQLGDIQEEEPTFFDPESIPDSVPIPMADWVFEVPVDVKNLPDEVQKMMVVCKVYGLYHGKWPKIGENGKILPIIDGSCNKDVLIGVQYQHKDDMPPNPPKRSEYRCIMYLRGPGPDNTWAFPSDAKVSPLWRQADPEKSFTFSVKGTIH